MASQSCSQCPALRHTIVHQQSQINQLTKQISYLRQRLAFLVGAVRATAEFIGQELTEPTMPRKKMLPAVTNRLTYALATVEGRR
jgi:hypothetical protein